MTIFREPSVIFVAVYPHKNTLPEPVVSRRPARSPRAVFQLPISLFLNASIPTAVLYDPVVLKYRAALPIEVLFTPVVFQANQPTAVLYDPVVF